MKLHDLKAQRADKLRTKLDIATKLRVIAEKDDGPDGPSVEDVSDADNMRAQLAQINADVSAMDVRISDIEGFISAQAEAAQQVDAINDDAPADVAGDGDAGAGDTGAASFRAGVPVQLKNGRVPAQARVPEPLGFKAARFVIGVLAAKTLGQRGAADLISKRFGDAEVAKALNTTGAATGGALIPQAFSNEIIELLRARTVVRGLDPVIYPMQSGNLTIPRQAAGAQSGYQGELDDIALTQATFDDLQLNAKKLVTMTSASNDLIRRVPFGIENIIRDDLLQSIARREDLAFLIGDGSGGSPVGLLNQCSAQNKLIANPLIDPNDNGKTLAQVVGVLNGLELTLEMGMSNMIRPAWITSPQVTKFLMGLQNAVGGMFVFQDELAQGKLRSLPIATTQQLPTNLNTGTAGAPVNNGSFLFLVDMADVILAETFGVTVEASDVASFKDSGGNTVNAFQRDLSVFRVITEHDLGLRHQPSLAVAVLPGWAPAGYNGFGPGAAFAVQPLNTLGSAAPSTGATNSPSGSNNPGNSSAAVPGGTLPGRAS